jgi:hypothetical protein
MRNPSDRPPTPPVPDCRARLERVIDLLRGGDRSDPADNHANLDQVPSFAYTVGNRRRVSGGEAMADISSSESHGPAPSGQATLVPFPPTEQAQLRADDIHAVRVVAGLMTVIFLVGLVLYFVVLLTTL